MMMSDLKPAELVAPTVELSGTDFKKMVDSKEAFQLYGPNSSRWIHTMIEDSARTANEDFGKAFPVSIPSSKYDSPFYHLSSSLSSEEKIRPKYLVTSPFTLGGTEQDDVGNDMPMKYPSDIIISDTTFEGEVYLGPFKTDYDIDFRNCIFKKGITSSFGFECYEMEFNNCIFEKNSHFKNASDFIKFIKCQIDSINFESSPEFNPNFLLVGDCLVNEVTFRGIQFNNVFFENNNIDNFNIPTYLTLTGNSLGSNPPIRFNELAIFSKDGNNKYDIGNVDVNKLILAGIVGNNNRISIKDASVQELVISELINSGQVRFHKLSIKEGGTVRITDSYLGKSEFSDVDFGAIRKFEVFYSNLSEIIITNTNFPDIIVGRDIKDFNEVREAYRQLKYAASKQGDKIRELFFEKLEFKAYYDSLGWKANFSDKFVLFTNKSNDYGHNWFKPISFLIIFSIPLFMMIHYGFGDNYYIGLPTLFEISQFLNFSLNPLHDFDRVFMLDKSIKVNQFGGSRLIDTFGRLLSGYFIFQFLRAFRKYYK